MALSSVVGLDNFLDNCIIAVAATIIRYCHEQNL